VHFARSRLSIGGKTESSCALIFASEIAIGSVMVASSDGAVAAAGAASTGTGTSKCPPHDKEANATTKLVRRATTRDEELLALYMTV
jgi:hypothetical protein